MSQDLELQRLAVLDNAAWCLSMWRAHGLQVQRALGMTMCQGDPPRFYPNAVTIDPGADAAVQIDWLAHVAKEGAPGGFTVKDSFNRLDLSRHGYRRLFEAQWLHRPKGAPAPRPTLDWRLVETADELSVWESAWAAGDPPGQRVFAPALLANTGVGVMGGWLGDDLVAGCVLTPLEDVTGLGNVFGDYAETVAIAAAMFPNAALVGYERGPDLDRARDCGFAEVGALVVWSSPA